MDSVGGKVEKPAAAPPEPADPVLADQKRLALLQVLESETFARSDQLRNFLKYVAEMAIEGRSREVTEYLIAVQALGRPHDFSPADDSSVRSRAHELRRKLEKYYESENPAAALRIELPKGSYTPRFLSRAEAPAAVQPEASIGADPPASRRWPAAAVAVTVLAAIVIAVQGWMLWRVTPSRSPNPVVTEAWGPLATPDSNVLVGVATPLHLIVRPYMTIVAEGFPKYSAPQELYSMYRQHRPLPDGTELDMHPVDNSIQMGHMGAVLRLMEVLQSSGAPFQVLPERSAPISAMRGRNVILIGDPQDSAAAAGLLEKTPFTIDYDPGTQDMLVRDRRPGHAPYLPKRGPDKRYSDTFGLVTVLPSPGARDNERVVILSGITSVGSQGAAEYFSSARDLSALKKLFVGQGLSGFPTAYQVLVHCKSNDTLLVSEEYTAHVVIP